MHPNPWSRTAKLTGMLIGIAFILTGCWDRLEIEERAVVLAIAIDQAPPKAIDEEKEVSHIGGKIPQSQKRMLRLTAQIGIPGRIPLGPAEGGSGGGEKPVWVLSVVGHTIEETFSNLQQEVSDRLFLGHLRVIAVNERVAEQGLQNMNDALRRNPEVRRAAWMVISKGKASDLLTLDPELERVPALYLMSTLDGAVKLGKLPDAFLGGYWTMLSSKGQEGYLPYVELMENKTILISGLAYFNRDKMVGKTTPLEIGHYMAMKGINPGGYSVLTPVPGKPGAVLYQANRRKAKMKVEIKNGRPHATFKVHIEGDLLEKSNSQFTLDTPGIIKEIEDRLGKDAEKAFKNLVEKTQKHGSDIFGIGEMVRGRYSSYWKKNINTKVKWEEMYKELPVDVQVTINIRRVGMKAR